MAEGKDNRSAFMTDIQSTLDSMIGAIKVAAPPPAERIISDAPVIGKCPVCQEPVRERRSVYACDRGRGCEFVVFKTMSKRKISKTTVKQLLSSGHSKPLKNFKSQKGNLFEAALILDENNKVVFSFSNNPRPAQKQAAPKQAAQKQAAQKQAAPKQAAQKQAASAPASPGRVSPRRGASGGVGLSTPVGMSCPRCRGGHLIEGRAAWGCDRWRSGCRFVLPFSVDGLSRTPAEAARLVAAAQSTG
jgi:DNA topoisomerase-3